MEICPTCRTSMPAALLPLHQRLQTGKALSDLSKEEAQAAAIMQSVRGNPKGPHKRSKKEYHEQYRQEHRDEIRERQHHYYHKGGGREKKHDYYQDHRDEIREKKRDYSRYYYQDHRDEIREKKQQKRREANARHAIANAYGAKVRFVGKIVIDQWSPPIGFF